MNSTKLTEYLRVSMDDDRLNVNSILEKYFSKEKTFLETFRDLRFYILERRIGITEEENWRLKGILLQIYKEPVEADWKHLSEEERIFLEKNLLPWIEEIKPEVEEIFTKILSST